jgi:Tol biopolymer transport system component
MVPADGGAPRHLFDAYNCSNPEFGPDDASLYWSAAASRTETNMRVYRVALDTASYTPVGEPAAILPFDDSLMIDGLSIAQDGMLTVGAIHGDTNLWVVDLDGRHVASDPRRLTGETVRAGVPVFAPDGRIAYTQMGNGRPVATWIMNGDGTNQEPLLSGESSVNPVWSTDGRRIMVADGEGAYWWVDVATRMRTKAAISGADIRNARLSPDGREVVFHAIDPSGLINVWAQSIDGGPRRRITSDGESAAYPAWSPDGKWIAVEIKRDERTYVGVVSRDGGAIEQLTSERGQSWPHSWSPDGEHIVFAAERDGIWNLEEVNRQTRQTRSLTRFTSPSGYVRYPTWSPDGQRIVFERNTRVGTVWTVKVR